MTTTGSAFRCSERIDAVWVLTRLCLDWGNGESSEETDFAGEPVFVLSLDHLIVNKKESGRLQDLADVEQLERLARLREQE